MLANLTRVLILCSWAVWLGGLCALLFFVTRLFSTAPRPIAVEAAPVLFKSFAIYQIIIGIVACASGAALAVLTRRRVHAVLTLFMLASLSIAILISGWTDRMESIRRAGMHAGPEFKAMHARSSIGYVAMAGLLTSAGIGFILTPATTHRKAAETVPATGSPGEAAGRSPVT